MIKYFLISIYIFTIGCGVKSDVIPPEEPWVIFESPKKKTTNKKSKNGEKKNVNK